MARVLIIGASKGIGLETTRQALEAGPGRALARSAASIGLSDPKREKVRGDALISKDIEAALNGIEVVIQTLGISMGGHVSASKPFLSRNARSGERYGKPGGEAADLLIGFGAGDSYASISFLQLVPFRLVLGRAYDDKSVQERR